MTMKRSISLMILFMGLPFFSMPCGLSEELYIFQEGSSIRITNIPAPGYVKKVGKPKQEIAWRPTPGKFQHLEGYIDSIASQYSVSPSLVKAVIQVESAFNPSAVSPKGAKGLMQLMDSTASELGVNNIFDPYENIKGGVKYLRYLLDIFEEDLSLALAAYNAGSETVLKYEGIPPYPETISYVKNVMNLLESPGAIKMGAKVHERKSNISMEMDSNGRILITN
jgi:soluble lytic murein transglycosylase-like protein